MTKDRFMGLKWGCCFFEEKEETKAGPKRRLSMLDNSCVKNVDVDDSINKHMRKGIWLGIGMLSYQNISNLNSYRSNR